MKQENAMAAVAHPYDFKVVFTRHAFRVCQAIISPLKLDELITLGAGGSFTNL
jgi:hypothetical protein